MRVPDKEARQKRERVDEIANNPLYQKNDLEVQLKILTVLTSEGFWALKTMFRVYKFNLE